MKNLTSQLMITSLTTLSLAFSAVVNAEDRLNGRQAADVCKQEITAAYLNDSSDSKIKFSRNPASSIKGGAYKFWINSTETADGDKNSIRYLCEITRSGELVGLTREDGRWRI